MLNINKKCSIKTIKDRKKWETKIETKNKRNKEKTVTNMVNINPSVSIITLKVKGLNVPNKRQRLSKQIKNKTQICDDYMKHTLNMKTHMKENTQGGSTPC